MIGVRSKEGEYIDTLERRRSRSEYECVESRRGGCGLVEAEAEAEEERVGFITPESQAFTVSSSFVGRRIKLASGSGSLSSEQRE